VSVTLPRAGENENLTRIVVSVFDYYSGLDPNSFVVWADFDIDGVAAGENLAPRMKESSEGVWQLDLAKPITSLARGTLTVTTRDRQGNTTKLARTFSVRQKR
jgi:hypothetical protein